MCLLTMQWNELNSVAVLKIAPKNKKSKTFPPLPLYIFNTFHTHVHSTKQSCAFYNTCCEYFDVPQQVVATRVAAAAISRRTGASQFQKERERERQSMIGHKLADRYVFSAAKSHLKNINMSPSLAASPNSQFLFFFFYLTVLKRDRPEVFVRPAHT